MLKNHLNIISSSNLDDSERNRYDFRFVNNKELGIYHSSKRAFPIIRGILGQLGIAVKITKQTPDLLVLKKSSLFSKLVGVLLTLIGLVTVVWFLTPFQIHCKEKSPGLSKRCSVTHFFRDTFIEPMILDQLHDAQLTYTRSKKGALSYKIRLITSRGAMNLTAVNGPSVKLMQNAIKAISQYIRLSDKTSITIPRFYPWYLSVIFAVIGFIGMYLLSISKKISYIFDKNNNTLTRSEKKLLGEIKQTSWDLSDLDKAHLQHRKNSQQEAYQLVCQLKSGEVIEMTHFLMNGKSHLEQANRTINKFLGRQL